jgi:hypothetical protein
MVFVIELNVSVIFFSNCDGLTLIGAIAAFRGLSVVSFLVLAANVAAGTKAAAAPSAGPFTARFKNSLREVLVIMICFSFSIGLLGVFIAICSFSAW